MYLVDDLASSYGSKNADDMPIEPHGVKSYTVSVSNVDDDKLNSSLIFLKNQLDVKTYSTLRCSFSQNVQIKRSRRALLETFTVIYVLDK